MRLCHQIRQWSGIVITTDWEVWPSLLYSLHLALLFSPTAPRKHLRLLSPETHDKKNTRTEDIPASSSLGPPPSSNYVFIYAHGTEQNNLVRRSASSKKTRGPSSLQKTNSISSRTEDFAYMVSVAS